ncbi:uracil-DNA glycosylase [Morchella conica CCBAS932]|uniref:Uracil-DNA glycosylase n=1 Tax=Morchella conica CCBAS932 TaxID=1392247 RepID=A0A3N4KRP6_9PEZI|nr:uracil-DNA glycosylase [Morchella conica CCBAS932]
MSGNIKRKATESPAVITKKARAITSFFAPLGAASSSAPADSAPNASTSTRPKFDKERWASKLSDEHKSLLQLEINTMEQSWFRALKDELITPEFLSLKRFLRNEKDGGKTIYPPEEDIYSWTRFTPIDQVKVVILGQDPYHGPNQAMGLSFSVRPPTPAPPSLKNIYIALKRDYPSFGPPPNKGGLLTPWAYQGVLMLNACLTVRASDANSHSNKGWEPLTQKAIDIIAQRRSQGVVFMAWGAHAAKRVLKIDKEKHLVLNSVHPSPLSASRGFFDCGHFKKANEWIISRYGVDSEVDWNLDGTKLPKKIVAPPDSTKDEDVPSTKDSVVLEDGDNGSYGDTFDTDEEEAMVQALMEMEKK